MLAHLCLEEPIVRAARDLQDGPTGVPQCLVALNVPGPLRFGLAVMITFILQRQLLVFIPQVWFDYFPVD